MVIYCWTFIWSGWWPEIIWNLSRQHFERRPGHTGKKFIYLRNWEKASSQWEKYLRTRKGQITCLEQISDKWWRPDHRGANIWEIEKARSQWSKYLRRAIIFEPHFTFLQREINLLRRKCFEEHETAIFGITWCDLIKGELQTFTFKEEFEGQRQKASCEMQSVWIYFCSRESCFWFSNHLIDLIILLISRVNSSWFSNYLMGSFWFSNYLMGSRVNVVNVLAPRRGKVHQEAEIRYWVWAPLLILSWRPFVPLNFVLRPL